MHSRDGVSQYGGNRQLRDSSKRAMRDGRAGVNLKPE